MAVSQLERFAVGLQGSDSRVGSRAHSRIEYPAAIVTNACQRELAEAAMVNDKPFGLAAG
jgi:hypothetical protein